MDNVASYIQCLFNIPLAVAVGGKPLRNKACVYGTDAVGFAVGKSCSSIVGWTSLFVTYSPGLLGTLDIKIG